MVLDYYNLREQPFGVTPDFRYLFLSASHREALASLLYGIDSGRGFLATDRNAGVRKDDVAPSCLESSPGQGQNGISFPNGLYFDGSSAGSAHGPRRS